MKFYIDDYFWPYGHCISTAAGQCVDGSVILNPQPGSNNTAGMVLICKGGVWGVVVSPNSWSGLNAQVTCRQLGFSGCKLSTCTGYTWIIQMTHFVYSITDSVSYASSFYFPGYNVGLHFSNVQCNGSEQSLFDCPKSDAVVMDASIYGDNVGVKCFNESRQSLLALLALCNSINNGIACTWKFHLTSSTKPVIKIRFCAIAGSIFSTLGWALRIQISQTLFTLLLNTRNSLPFLSACVQSWVPAVFTVLCVLSAVTPPSKAELRSVSTASGVPYVMTSGPMTHPM